MWNYPVYCPSLPPLRLWFVCVCLCVSVCIADRWWWCHNPTPPPPSRLSRATAAAATSPVEISRGSLSLSDIWFPETVHLTTHTWPPYTGEGRGGRRHYGEAVKGRTKSFIEDLPFDDWRGQKTELGLGVWEGGAWAGGPATRRRSYTWPTLLGLAHTHTHTHTHTYKHYTQCPHTNVNINKNKCMYMNTHR